MMKKHIFISSVQSEFEEERKRLAEYIRQDALFSRYFEPFLFEELPAQDVSAQVAYLEQAAKSEVYILLVGEQYGYQDTEGVSPTEREYDTATSNHTYRIAFVKSVPKRNDKEEAFKKKIDRDVIRNVFNSYEELQSGVYASLVEYMTTHLILRQGPFDASIHPDARLEDLDKEKIRRFVGLAREKRQFPLLYSEEAIPQILNSLHLMTDEGKLKNAALLLFAKDVQKWFVSATIKCAHFYGTKMQKPIASLQIYGGSVFEQVDMAVSFVMARIDQRVGERIHSAEVDVTPELPAQAVTEAIVNAVVHRDYTSTGSVQVMLFKDRLEIWNPGRLPHGMTVEKLNSRHNSQPVNPVLANPVYLTGYIEQMGTGTTDIIEQCENYGLRKPEFIQDEDFLTILWRPKKEDVYGEKITELDEKVSKLDGKVIEFDEKSNRVQSKSNIVRLTAKQKKVLEFCDGMPHTAQEILEMVGVKYQTKTVLQYTTKLVLMGLLRPTTTLPNDPNRKYITAHGEE